MIHISFLPLLAPIYGGYTPPHVTTKRQERARQENPHNKTDQDAAQAETLQYEDQLVPKRGRILVKLWIQKVRQ